MSVIGESRYLALGFAALVTIMVLAHCAAGDVVPLPSMDETSFAIPTLRFVHHLDFDASALGIKGGIYWLPAGFYLVNSLVFTVLGESLSSVRLAALLEILLCLPVIAILSQRLCGVFRWAQFALIAAWGCSASMLIAGNVGRPEALVLLLDFLSLLAALQDRRLGCLALGLLAGLIHPLLAVPALCLALIAVRGDGAAGGVRPWEIALMAVASAVLVLEICRFLGATEQYIAHLRFQLERKEARGWNAINSLNALSLASLLVLNIIKNKIAPRKIQLTLIWSLACLLIYTYGREIWYSAFAITGLLGFSLAGLALPLPRRWRQAPIALLLTAVATQWLLDIARGKLDEQPFLPADVENLGKDMRFVNEKAIEKIEEMSGDILISPWLFFYIPKMNLINVHTYAGLGFNYEVNFTHYVFYSMDKMDAYKMRKFNALDGYRCTNVEQLAGPQGFFFLNVITVAKTEKGLRYVPCAP